MQHAADLEDVASAHSASRLKHSHIVAVFPPLVVAVGVTFASGVLNPSDMVTAFAAGSALVVVFILAALLYGSEVSNLVRRDPLAYANFTVPQSGP